LLEIEPPRDKRRAAKHQIDQMVLHPLDVWVREPSVLTDVERSEQIRIPRTIG
jgi:hypothetical protein